MFVTGKLFQTSLMFEGKAGAYLSGGTQKMSPPPFYGRLLALPTNITLGWKGLSETNSSLLRTLIIYGRKCFYNIGPRIRNFGVNLIPVFGKLDHFGVLRK